MCNSHWYGMMTSEEARRHSINAMAGYSITPGTVEEALTCLQCNLHGRHISKTNRIRFTWQLMLIKTIYNRQWIFVTCGHLKLNSIEECLPCCPSVFLNPFYCLFMSLRSLCWGPALPICILVSRQHYHCLYSIHYILSCCR